MLLFFTHGKIRWIGARIYLEIYERLIQASSSNGDFMYCELYPPPDSKERCNNSPIIGVFNLSNQLPSGSKR